MALWNGGYQSISYGGFALLHALVAVCSRNGIAGSGIIDSDRQCECVVE